MTCSGAWIRPRIAILAAVSVLLAVAPVGVAQHSTASVQTTSDELMAEGAGIYRQRCARCHGRNGEGQRQGHDAAPRLTGTFARLSVAEIATRLIRGGSYMPPFDTLSDRQIAAVASYIRNAFGNALGPAGEEDIAQYRQ